MKLHAIIHTNQFDGIVIFTIILSSLILALDQPILDPDTTYKKVLLYIDYVTTVIFVIEFLFKSISLGFLFCGEGAYLRSFSNIVDFLIVIFSVIGSFSQGGSKLDKVKVLRIARVLRPLKILSRN